KDVRLLVAIYRYLADCQRRYRPTSAHDEPVLKVTSGMVLSNVHEAMQVGEDAVKRLYDLLTQEPGTWIQGSKSADGNWELVVAPEIRRYRDVSTMEDYLVRRAGLPGGEQLLEAVGVES